MAARGLLPRCSTTLRLRVEPASTSRRVFSSTCAASNKQNEGQESGTELDPDSLQARLIRSLEERCAPPSATNSTTTTRRAQLSLRQPVPPAAPKHDPSADPETRAASAVSQVVAESLSHAEQVGATQAAIIAESSTGSGSSTTPGLHSASPPPTEEIKPPQLGTYEEGRFLPKTPDGQPWNAKYVRPAHAGSKGDSIVPSIHYGKLLSGRSGSSSSMKSTSQRLKDLGVNPSSLPLDDAKAMRAVRDGIRRFERASRVYGAKYGAHQYKGVKLSSEEVSQLESEIELEMAKSRKRKAEGATDADEDHFQNGQDEDSRDSNVTRLGRQMPEARDSSRSGGAGGSMSLRRWTSVADERIEAARAAGFFKENKLRGKPLEWEVHERNPYLGKEEFLMNRIVKRQGAAPPWVELNHEFHSDLNTLRSKMIDAYSRRAVRHYTRNGMLASSGGPGTGTSGGTESQRREYFLSLARSYRDGEWVAQEKGYHTEAVKDLNQTLRKHNNISPPSARRGMVVREEELTRCFTESVPVIADGLEEAWLEVTGRKVRPDRMGGFGAGIGSTTFDMWGNAVEHRRSTSGNDAQSSWMGLSSLFAKSSPSTSGGGGGGSSNDREDGVMHRTGNEEDDQTARRTDPHDSTPYLGQGIFAKIKTWLLPPSAGNQDGRSGDDARRSGQS